MKLKTGFNCCFVEDGDIYGLIPYAHVERIFLVNDVIEIVLASGKIYQFPFSVIVDIDGKQFETARAAFDYATQYWN